MLHDVVRLLAALGKLLGVAELLQIHSNNKNSTNNRITQQ